MFREKPPNGSRDTDENIPFSSSEVPVIIDLLQTNILVVAPARRVGGIIRKILRKQGDLHTQTHFVPQVKSPSLLTKRNETYICCNACSAVYYVS
jgi:hypothetical protein